MMLCAKCRDPCFTCDTVAHRLQQSDIPLETPLPLDPNIHKQYILPYRKRSSAIVKELGIAESGRRFKTVGSASSSPFTPKGRRAIRKPGKFNALADEVLLKEWSLIAGTGSASRCGMTRLDAGNIALALLQQVGISFTNKQVLGRMCCLRQLFDRVLDRSICGVIPAGEEMKEFRYFQQVEKLFPERRKQRAESLARKRPREKGNSAMFLSSGSRKMEVIEYIEDKGNKDTLENASKLATFMQKPKERKKVDSRKSGPDLPHPDSASRGKPTSEHQSLFFDQDERHPASPWVVLSAKESVTLVNRPRMQEETTLEPQTSTEEVHRTSLPSATLLSPSPVEKGKHGFSLSQNMECKAWISPGGASNESKAASTKRLCVSADFAALHGWSDGKWPGWRVSREATGERKSTINDVSIAQSDPRGKAALQSESRSDNKSREPTTVLP